MADVPSLETHRAHSARVYDYLLGGKNNYAADAEAAQLALEAWPACRAVALHNRAFMHRAVRYLVAEAGVRQFLDIGTGIPTEPNLHQIAQRAAPEARVVYVDNDPIVLQYAEALTRSTPEGRTAYLHADVRDPEAVLESEQVRDVLDLSRPVALSTVALLHHVTDEHEAHALVRRLTDALPSGSHLVLTHGSADFMPAETVDRAMSAYGSAVNETRARTREEILRFFSGMEVVEPGLVVVSGWRPDPAQELPEATDAELSVYGGVARKP